MKNAREHVKGVAVDSLIWVIGGHSKPSTTKINQSAVEAYSPMSDKWYDKGMMPNPRGGIGASYLGGKIYVFGGEGANFSLFNRVDQLDPADGSWAKVNDLPFTGGLHGQATITYNGKAHLVGGSNPAGFDPKNYHEIFTVPGSGSLSLGGDRVGTYKVRKIMGGIRIEGLSSGMHRLTILHTTGQVLRSEFISRDAVDLYDVNFLPGPLLFKIGAHSGILP
jgi:hypothetical protein